MTDQNRLHELLDLVEFARNEGDAETEAKAIAAYKNESKAIELEQKKAALRASNPAEHDPASKEWQERHGAIAGMSNYERFMAGAGKAVADTGRGLKQIGLEVAQPFRNPDATTLVTGQNQAQRYRAQIDENKKLDAPLMNTGAGLAGNIGGHAAMTLIPGGAVTKGAKALNLTRTAAAANAFVNPLTIRGAAGAGAILGALQPVGTDESRLMNAGIGGALGGATQGIVQGIGRIAQPIKNALSSVDEKAVSILAAADVPLDAAQKTGSQRAMQLKRFLTDNPITAGGQAEQAEKTAAGFTRAVLKEIGENADSADESILGGAATRISSEFERIATNNPIKVDNKLLNDLVAVSQGADNELESSAAQVIAKQIDEVMAKAGNGAIDGKAFQSIKSTLDRISNGQNQQLGFWARNLRDKLDDALQRSVSPQDAAALKLARKQYGALQNVIKAVNPDGYVSPSKLYNATNVKAFGQKKAMATGIRQSQLQQLAKAGKRVIPERMPNSGTTPRGMLQALLPTAAGGLYGATQEGGMSDVAKFAALGAGLPFLARSMLNNPKSAEYLARGISGPLRDALLSGPSTAPGLVARQLPLALLAAQSQQ